MSRATRLNSGVRQADAAATFASFPVQASESGVINAQYPYGDARRHGIFPDGTTNWGLNQTAKINAWLGSIAALGVTGFIPAGFYNSELNINQGNVRLRFEEGAEWAGLVHVEPTTPASDPLITGVVLLGTVVTYDRFGTAATSGTYIERIRCKSDPTKNVSQAGSKGRGVHIYVRTQDFTCDEIVVDDFDQASVNNDAAVSIDGFGNNPIRVSIGRIHIKKTDLHGLYLTGQGHKIGDVTVDEYGAGAYSGSGLQDANGLAQSQELKGVWINRAWNGRIDRINVGQGTGTRTNAVYDVLLDESGLSGAAGTVEVGEINCSNVLNRGVSFSDATYAPNVLSVWKVGTIRVTTPTGRAPIAGFGAVTAASPADVVVDTIRLTSLDTFDGVVTASGSKLSAGLIDAGAAYKDRLLYAQGYVNVGEVRGTRTAAGSSSPSIELAGSGSADSRVGVAWLPFSVSLAVKALLLSGPRPSVGKFYNTNCATSGGALTFASGCTQPTIRDFQIVGPGSAGTGMSINSTPDLLLDHGTISGFAKGVAGTGTNSRAAAVGVNVTSCTTLTDLATGSVQMLGCNGLTL